MNWVRPELVAEVKYLTWTEDNLLRQVVYQGLREDKPAAEVRRAAPYPQQAEPAHPAASVRLTAASSAHRSYFLAGCTASRPGKPGAALLLNFPVRTHRLLAAASGRPTFTHVYALLSSFS
jgi:hypothetical protein